MFMLCDAVKRLIITNQFILRVSDTTVSIMLDLKGVFSFSIDVDLLLSAGSNLKINL